VSCAGATRGCFLLILILFLSTYYSTLLLQSSGCLFAYLIQPTWLLAIYYPLVLVVMVSLSCISCRNPGLVERVTDEEAGDAGWSWNEQVGSLRPPGALYCHKCGVLIQDFDHL